MKIKYNLTIDELVKLCRDFQADNYDGFISNDKSYIENWIDNKYLKDKLYASLKKPQ